MKIDVVMCTRNSERLLEECLTSIYKEIPLCHLIIIDGFSEDRTLEIVGRFERNYGNIKIIQTKARLGKSREIGIGNVDTDWFAFIDSDVIFREGWFGKIIDPLLKESKLIGAMESNLIHHYPESTPKFPEFKRVVNGKRIESRGLTIATLIKREVVKDIRIPDDLLIYEDEFIKRWIESKGFRWLKVTDPIINHFPAPKPFKDAYLTGVYSIRYNLFPAWRIIIVSIFFPLKLFYFWIKTKSFKASLNSVIYSFYMLRGLIDEVLRFLPKRK